MSALSYRIARRSDMSSVMTLLTDTLYMAVSTSQWAYTSLCQNGSFQLNVYSQAQLLYLFKPRVRVDFCLYPSVQSVLHISLTQLRVNESFAFTLSVPTAGDELEPKYHWSKYSGIIENNVWSPSKMRDESKRGLRRHLLVTRRSSATF